MSGRCGLVHFGRTCYALNSKCYKCGNFGHYARVCRTIRETSHTETTKVKSKGKQDRDSRRLSTYLERKQFLRELSFSAVRPGIFRDCVADNSKIKEELSLVKRKLSETQVKCNDFENKCKNIASELAESSKRETVLRKFLTTVRNQNENVITELNQDQKNIDDNGKLMTKLQNVEKELGSKTKFWEFYEDRCLEMKADYIQQLNDEKVKFEKLQKRNEDLENDLNVLSMHVKQLESENKSYQQWNSRQQCEPPQIPASEQQRKGSLWKIVQTRGRVLRGKEEYMTGNYCENSKI